MLVLDDVVKVPPLRLPVAVMSTTCVPGVRVLVSIVSGKSPTYNTGGREKAILIKGTAFLLGKLKLERTMQCHLATVISASYKLRLSNYLHGAQCFPSTPKLQCIPYKENSKHYPHYSPQPAVTHIRLR